jgi:anaerobic magnesium-protoporphyrin IX monomethyl ester cyclase
MDKFKVALINPPYFPRFSRSQRSPGVIKSGTMYYPYWLAHAAAVLEKKGFEIFLYDCPAADMTRESLLSQLDSYQPDLCIFESSTASTRNDCELASEIHQRFQKARICMVGTHATATWQDVLREYPQIDYVAIGEYDYIVSDLAEALVDDRNNPGASILERISKIPALGFRLGDGSVERGSIREPIADVDGLPWIAPIYKRFLDVKNYYFSLASYPMVMLIGGRGCVAKCTYCVYPQVMHGHSYRTRTPASIVGEMKWVQENMPQVKEIVFEDDTFTGDRDFAKEVARLVQEQCVHLKWFANVRTNVDRETLAHMKTAGFRCCATGFESGDDVLLKNMWKGQTVEAQKRFVKDAQSLGILVHGCFMFGFPGESRETMEKTLKLAIDLAPDSAQFYPVMPFPGTTFYKWAKENGYLATDRFEEWLNREGGHRCVLNLPGLRAEEIEKFCETAYSRFYFRPKYMLFKLKQAFLYPLEGIRSVKSFLYFLVYLFTNKRDKEVSFNLPSIPVPSDWYSVKKLPRGRMYEQSVQLRELKEGHVKSSQKEAPLDDRQAALTPEELKSLAKRLPDL